MKSLISTVILLWSFVFLAGCTTGLMWVDLEDTSPPEILSVFPQDGATNVAVNASVQAVFNKVMDVSSINTDTFTLSSAVAAVDGIVSFDAGTKTATFAPSSNLASFTTYTAMIASTAKDGAGNGLGSDHSWSFTTSDIIAPSVSLVSPLNGSTNQYLGVGVTAVFSEEMDATTINIDTFRVTRGGGGGDVAGTVSYNTVTKTATLVPDIPLGNSLTYTVTLDSTITDAQGVELGIDYSWSFSTAAYSLSQRCRIKGDADVSFGIAVDFIGDVNGDGYGDFIVGAHNYGWGAGIVYVYSGIDCKPLQQINGPPGGNLGFSVAGLGGDVNGDDRPDFIAGAYWADPGGLSDAGSAFVYSGATCDVIYQKDGEADSAQFGISVDGGDVNGDGTPDFIVGAYGAGSASVYSGATGNLLHQKTVVGEGFGWPVASVGDVNGDGLDDFAVRAADIGKVYVYSGADGTELYQINGETAGDWFGWPVDGLWGDVDGDGYDDIIVGASYADPGGLTDAGRAYVYSGNTGALLYQINGETANDALGYDMAGAGDLTGEGIPDFIVGASYFNYGVGKAYIHSGLGTGLWSITGQTANDLFGYSARGGGDVNGDGKPDVIIGAPGGGKAGAGNKVYVFVSGPVGEDAIESLFLLSDGSQDEGAEGEEGGGGLEMMIMEEGG